MKKLIKYYSLFMTILLCFSNAIFTFLSIKGILYQIIMYFLIIINIFMLLEYRDSIKYKKVSLVVLFLLIITAKNALNLYFILTFIVVLLITEFKKSIFIKLLSFLSLIFCVVFFYPLLFIFLFTFGESLDGTVIESKIYEDKHYLCNNNTEVFVASSGAFDGFHYYGGKYYKILKLDDIIYISVRFNREISQDEYEKIYSTNKCVLVGDGIES